ncbi:MAG: hypothetical protein AAF438_13305 [Pseudomonadota bacterium]
MYSEWISNTTKYTKDGVERAANLVESGVTPVNYVVNTAIRLSDIANHSANRFLEHQRDMAIGTVEASAHRLKVAASASGVRELVKDQVQLIPATRDRIKQDASKAWGIVLETLDELRTLFSDGAKGLNQTAKTASKKASKTAASAKKAVKKAASA